MQPAKTYRLGRHNLETSNLGWRSIFAWGRLSSIIPPQRKGQLPAEEGLHADGSGIRPRAIITAEITDPAHGKHPLATPTAFAYIRKPIPGLISRPEVGGFNILGRRRGH